MHVVGDGCFQFLIEFVHRQISDQSQHSLYSDDVKFCFWCSEFPRGNFDWHHHRLLVFVIAFLIAWTMSDTTNFRCVKISSLCKYAVCHRNLCDIVVRVCFVRRVCLCWNFSLLVINFHRWKMILWKAFKRKLVGLIREYFGNLHNKITILY